MKVVFLEDVEGTAQVGDVKDVKNGFARNFLLPRGLAVAATKDNLFRAEALAERENRRQAKLDEEWAPTADRLRDYTVTMEARVGETGRLYGSVTNRDIAEALTKQIGRDIEQRQVLLPEPIRELGPHPVPVKLTRSTTIDVNVEVVPDEQSKGIVARMEAEKAEREERERRDAEAAAYRARQARAQREEAEAEAETEVEDADETEEPAEADTATEAEETEAS
jgi:large subunit ribosomal protein L9